MYGSGVRIGMAHTHLLLKLTLLVHLRALIGCTVAVAGSAMRGAAVYRFATTTRRLFATTASVSVWPFSYLLLPDWSGFASRAAAGTQSRHGKPCREKPRKQNNAAEGGSRKLIRDNKAMNHAN